MTEQVTENTATVSWAPVQAVIDRYLVRYTSADIRWPAVRSPWRQRLLLSIPAKKNEVAAVKIGLNGSAATGRACRPGFWAASLPFSEIFLSRGPMTSRTRSF